MTAAWETRSWASIAQGPANSVPDHWALHKLEKSPPSVGHSQQPARPQHLPFSAVHAFIDSTHVY